MTKQEEIREAIKTCIAIEQSCGEVDGNRLAEQIMRVENELGVVIKVDRELPVVETYCKLANVECIPKLTVQQHMLKAGYVAVEPLIEE